MLAQQDVDGITPWFTQTDEQQLMIAAGAFLAAVIVNRFISRSGVRAFDDEGIEIPFPQRTMHRAEGVHLAATPPPPPRRSGEIRGKDGDRDEPVSKDPFSRGHHDQVRMRDLQDALVSYSGVDAVDLLAHLDEVQEVIGQGAMGLFLDIDGTLAHIAPNPKEVSIAPAVRQALGIISQRMSVVVETGRSVEDARNIIGLSSVIYVGNHGLEVWERGSASVLPAARRYIRQMSDLAKAVNQRMPYAEGVLVEDKGPTISVHYRQASDPNAAREAILQFLSTAPEAKGFDVREGKMVFEVRPPVEADKGTALRSVTNRLGLKSAMVLGDDLTDADSFRAVHELAVQKGFRGIAVAVAGANAPVNLIAEADFHLLNPEAVEEFLTWLAEAPVLQSRPRFTAEDAAGGSDP